MESQIEGKAVENIPLGKAPKPVIFSVKLISGERILSELFTDDNIRTNGTDFLQMINPIVVSFIPTKDGQTTVGGEFDPMSDDNTILVPWDNVLTYPASASDFYREFYVKSLAMAFVRKARNALFLKSQSISQTDMEHLVEVVNTQVQNYINTITKYFDVDIASLSDDLGGSSSPDGVVLH